MKQTSLFLLIATFLTILPFSANASSVDPAFSSRLSGYILLQVEEHGEAWYVNPLTLRRSYLKDGSTAYALMRNLGLGISDDDLTKLQAGDASLVTRLKGRILLQVEQHGEAYYVYPKDGSVHYLKDGDAAYAVMRSLSLGITDADLGKIVSDDSITLASAPSIHTSPYQGGLVPADVDTSELNAYWLSVLNNLRAEHGNAPLVLDQRLVDSASAWAAYLGEQDLFTHTRPGGQTLEDWVAAWKMDFMTYGDSGSWTQNYFAESLALNYAADGGAAGAHAALDAATQMFLDEAPYNGPHYRTLFQDDWNSVGVGFWFEPISSGRYKVIGVFHFGSLK